MADGLAMLFAVAAATAPPVLATAAMSHELLQMLTAPRPDDMSPSSSMADGQATVGRWTMAHKKE
jgi:hypothetical protein